MSNFRERRRVVVSPKANNPKLNTRQEPKDACDVNLIVAQARRGIPPQWLGRRDPVFMDVSEVPKDLTAAYAAVQAAEEAFMALPADVRTAMDNDPRQLETWLHNPDNLEEAEKHGLLARRQAHVPPRSAPEARSPGDVSKARKEIKKAPPKGGADDDAE